MASHRRKSAAIALAVVGVAGLSLASAAQLNVGTASLGATTELVESCQPESGAAIAVGFTNDYNDTEGYYETTGVELTNVASTCNELDVRVTLADGDGGSIHEFTGTAVTGTTTLDLPAGAVDAREVESVSVVISG